jgi:hypothetical protein
VESMYAYLIKGNLQSYLFMRSRNLGRINFFALISINYLIYYIRVICAMLYI